MRTLFLLVSFSLLVGCGTSAYLIQAEECEKFGKKYIHCESKYVEALD